MFVLIQEKERNARRKGKPMQNDTSSSYPAEKEEMEDSGASGNEEEAPEDEEGLPAHSLSNDKIRRSIMDALIERRRCSL